MAPAPALKFSTSVLRDFTALRVLLRSLASFRRVVAFAIDRRHLRAHRTEIHRQLPAMMDGVMHQEIQVHDRRKLEHTAEVDDLEQLLAR